MATALVPNALFMVGLFGFIGWRVASGLSPMPDGATPFVLSFAAAIPILCVALGTAIRLRPQA